MAKDANSKEVKNKKHFFKDFKAELKKVIWPTPKQIVNNTIAVVTIVIITAFIVFALDSFFNFLNEKGIDRLKEIIRGDVQTELTEETTEEATEESEATDEKVNTQENAETPDENAANN